MPGLPAGFGKVGDLILTKARPLEQFHGFEVKVGLGVLVGEEEPCLHLTGQGGTGFHLQAVAGDVFRLQGQGGAEGLLPGFQALARQAVDEIKAEVVDLGPAQLRRGQLHLAGGVDAVDAAQLPGVGGLHPQRDPVDPGPAQGSHGAGVHAVGVALEGDLRLPAHGEAALKIEQQLPDALGAVIGGGAAAEVDGVDRPALHQGGPAFELGEEGLLVEVHLFLPARQGVEVAVVTFAPAKGDVDVKSQDASHASCLLPAGVRWISTIYYTIKQHDFQAAAIPEIQTCRGIQKVR